MPGGASVSSPIRQISTISPWKDTNGLGLACGPNVTSAALIAPVTAGSTIQLARERPSTKWTRGPWTHNIGPMLTYIAKVHLTSSLPSFNWLICIIFRYPPARLRTTSTRTRQTFSRSHRLGSKVKFGFRRHWVSAYNPCLLNYCVVEVCIAPRY